MRVTSDGLFVLIPITRDSRSALRSCFALAHKTQKNNACSAGYGESVASPKRLGVIDAAVKAVDHILRITIEAHAMEYHRKKYRTENICLLA